MSATDTSVMRKVLGEVGYVVGLWVFGLVGFAVFVWLLLQLPGLWA